MDNLIPQTISNICLGIKCQTFPTKPFHLTSREMVKWGDLWLPLICLTLYAKGSADRVGNGSSLLSPTISPASFCLISGREVNNKVIKCKSQRFFLETCISINIGLITIF